MIIEIEGCSYDLNDKDQFGIILSIVKRHIASLQFKDNRESLESILKQVEAHKTYCGTEAALLRAKELYMLLNEILNLVTTIASPAASTGTQKKRFKIKIDKPKVYGMALPAPVAVSYRRDEGKRMHGAFYDHYTIRNITEHETFICAAAGTDTTTLTTYITGSAGHGLGIHDVKGERIIPASTSNPAEEAGLLFIPGASRDKEEDPVRKAYEQQLIREARNRGQPVLAVCAGSWQLWEAFGGSLTTAIDHCYSSMPYIITDGGVGNNVMIHSLDIEPQTMLAKAMGIEASTPKLLANSIHWKAPDPTTVPAGLEVNATARPLPESEAPKNRTGKTLSSSTTVEGFETKAGVPMMGIQWHPEAYYRKDGKGSKDGYRHLAIIHYMTKAGDAYLAKRRVLTELTHSPPKLKSTATKSGLFAKPLIKPSGKVAPAGRKITIRPQNK